MIAGFAWVRHFIVLEWLTAAYSPQIYKNLYDFPVFNFKIM